MAQRVVLPPDHRHVVVAAEALRVTLRWPRPARDVLNLAREHVTEEIHEDAWGRAFHRLNVHLVDVDGEWWWTLPGDALISELADWLSTPTGRFAVYCAERDRLPLGQLELDLQTRRYG